MGRASSEVIEAWKAIESASQRRWWEIVSVRALGPVLPDVAREVGRVVVVDGHPRSMPPLPPGGTSPARVG